MANQFFKIIPKVVPFRPPSHPEKLQGYFEYSDSRSSPIKFATKQTTSMTALETHDAPKQRATIPKGLLLIQTKLKTPRKSQENRPHLNNGEYKLLSTSLNLLTQQSPLDRSGLFGQKCIESFTKGKTSTGIQQIRRLSTINRSFMTRLATRSVSSTSNDDSAGGGKKTIHAFTFRDELYSDEEIRNKTDTVLRDNYSSPPLMKVNSANNTHPLDSINLHSRKILSGDYKSVIKVFKDQHQTSRVLPNLSAISPCGKRCFLGKSEPEPVRASSLMNVKSTTTFQVNENNHQTLSVNYKDFANADFIYVAPKSKSRGDQFSKTDST